MPFFRSIADFVQRGPREFALVTEDLAASTHEELHNRLASTLPRATPKRTGEMKRRWISIPGAPVQVRRGGDRTVIGNTDPGAPIIAPGRRTAKSGRVVGSIKKPKGFGRPQIESLRRNKGRVFRKVFPAVEARHP